MCLDIIIILQNPLVKADLRQLSNETRKKFPPIKEAAESAILKIKTLTTLNQKHQQESPLSPLRKHCQIVLQVKVYHFYDSFSVSANFSEINFQYFFFNFQ